MNKAKKLLSVVLLAGTIASAQTLVTVNGKAITQEDVDSELMRATQGRFNQVPPEKQAAFRQQVLQQLIGKELIFEDAKKNGILKSKEYKEEYKKLEERMKEELAIQVWQKKLLDEIKISEKELKSYYKQNKEEFNEPKSVHARHILVATEDEAKKIISGLKSLSGEKLKDKFITEAKAKSTGPSGPKGGDLGYFTEGQMVPAFNDKVFSMKKGTVTTEPVKTQFGYHVIYLEDKKSAMTRKFDEVKAFIDQRLKMEKFKETMKKKMDSLQKKAVIK
ncbi:peptidylprolyl isomerase [Sulfurimonas microaerophilic]|uniref:peptidylprolyl isomerase n=1 Tax=Sulfurimonas microaerophilic TaxID=3058392 RepID=UPI002714855C|nr:peptidyl-prolyl cis-trans isomerase [Sulfurimonas sp. hsl 1-7]